MTPSKHLTTYRYADGTLVWGEFEWVTDIDYFDGDHDDDDVIIEERWQLVGTQIGTIHGPLCPECSGEGEEIGVGPCEACDGTGAWQGERITWTDGT